MNDRDQMFKWMMEANLSLTAEFHNHVNIILSEKVGEIKSMDDLDKGKRTYWTLNYDKHFRKKLRNTSFLLMFGHLEEMLLLLSKVYNPHGAELSRGTGLIKFKPYIKSLLDQEISTSRDYQIIRNAQFVRNSLLHIAGRVSLSKNKSELEKMVKSDKDSFIINNDRIQITARGLREFQVAVRGLTNMLLNQARKADSESGAAF